MPFPVSKDEKLISTSCCEYCGATYSTVKFLLLNLVGKLICNRCKMKQRDDLVSRGATIFSDASRII